LDSLKYLLTIRAEPASAPAPAVSVTIPAPAPVVHNTQKEESESWEDKMPVDTAPSAVSTKEIETQTKNLAISSEDAKKASDFSEGTYFVDSAELFEEQLKKELERMAQEENVSVDDLLKAEKAEEIIEEEVLGEDPREHLNVVFIGHVGLCRDCK
jgi:hypothetical protein